MARFPDRRLRVRGTTDIATGGHDGPGNLKRAGWGLGIRTSDRCPRGTAGGGPRRLGRRSPLVTAVRSAYRGRRGRLLIDAAVH